MGQLKNQNPQIYQTIQQAMSNGANPQELMKQMVRNTNPENMQTILTQAKNFGVPDSILGAIQNSK